MAQAGIAANIPPAEAPQQPAPYELVDGNQLVEAANALNEVTSLQQILHWIGFTIEEHRENLRIKSLGSYFNHQFCSQFLFLGERKNLGYNLPPPITEGDLHNK